MRKLIICAASCAFCWPAGAEACDKWDLNGDHVLHQSNGIDVKVHFDQDGNTITGGATFYSTAMVGDVGGPLEGFVDGDSMHFRVGWYVNDKACVHGWSGKSCSARHYDENGVYEGTISGNGELQGSNYPFERPNARTNWFLKDNLPCADKVAASTSPIIRMPTQKMQGPDDRRKNQILLPTEKLPSQVDKSGAVFEKPSAGVIPSPSAPPNTPPLDEVIPVQMDGTYTSTFGKLSLSQGTGAYEYNDGRVTVAHVDGRVAEGIWEQTKSSKQCPDGRYFGRFRFSFTASGFIGAYGYCNEEPSPSNLWNGTRI